MQTRLVHSANLLRLAALTFLSALCVAIASPSHGQASSTIIIGSEGVIPPLDPHRSSGTVALRVIDALYDPLIREDVSTVTDAAPALKPGLADSWTVSPDGLTYTFHIREAAFHDGTALDAAAVKANFERVTNKTSPLFDQRASGNMTFLTQWISETSVVDPRTFRITLKRPFSSLLRLLSDRRMSIISPKAIETYKGDELGQHPVGTGPFTLSEFKQGQPLTLKRNDKFWGGRIGFETLIFRPITDPTAMAINMQTGQVDVIPSANPQQVAQLKNDPAITVQYPEPANVYFVRFNLRAEVTKEKAFRQALNYAINRDNLSALSDGQAAPLYTTVPRGSEIFPGTPSGYSYDPEKAKKLLADAGIKTPLTITMLSPNTGPGFGLAGQMVTLIQRDLKAIGINLEPQFVEFATFVATESPGLKENVQTTFMGWVTGAESGYFLERMFGGNQQPPTGVNRGWYKNEAVDALLNKASVETNDAERIKFYREAAHIIDEDAPWVFLYQDRLPRAFRSRVTGINAAHSVFLDYTKMGLR